MAVIKLMIIDNVDTVYGPDRRCVYARHLLNEGVAEFHETYDTDVFFELAKAYLTEIDETVCSFDGAKIHRIF